MALLVAFAVGCMDHGAGQLLVNQGIDAEVAGGSGAADDIVAGGRRSAPVQEVDLLPIGLVGPGFTSVGAFATACDTAEDSFERCL